MLDEGAPAGIAESFEGAGHRAIRFLDVLAPKAKDDVVCAVAMENGAALIAVDNDMKHFKKRFGPVEAGKYTKMHLIHFSCSGVIAVKRAAHVMSFIEHEWRFTCDKAARSMWLDIGAHHIRSNR